MKFEIASDKMPFSPENFLRKAGYALLRDPRGGEYSFARRFSGGLYPRFHIYFDELPGRVVFNLHLDQKQASYSGFNRHGGEYGGELVEREAARLKRMILAIIN